MHEPEGGGLCAVMFDTEQGTAVCEAFGPHERHGGVLTASGWSVAAFQTSAQRRHSSRRRSSGG